MPKSKISDDDVIGLRFGKLIVLSVVRTVRISTKRPEKLIEYLCDCGCRGYVNRSKVVNGTNVSCGCVIQQLRKNLGKKRMLPEGEASFNNILTNYKRSASSRELEFELTKEEFKSLILKPCTYCGNAPSNVYDKHLANGSFTYNGIDRVDSNIGYVSGNCIPCCKVCNVMKKDYTLEFFKNHISKILANSDNWSIWLRTA